VAPVHRIPSEILALIPDFWDKHLDNRRRDLVALTHVCQAWREVFISRSSLWTDLDCEDEDETRVYLERSGSLPVNLTLETDDQLPFDHPFSKIIPHAIGRLRSLTILGTPENLQDITAHLLRPAPLLEKLWIHGGYHNAPHLNPMLPPTLLGGDLSSLRRLRLASVNTGLPWRNMVNLTSFSLFNPSPGEVSVKQLLDFFESAPRLRKVLLESATPTSGAQNGRLVSLACLEWMRTTGGGSASLLLDHLLIPVGARLDIETDLLAPQIEDYPPRFLDNLRNFANFTDIDLFTYELYAYMEFRGPNGQVGMTSRSPRVDNTCLVLESLAQFDTSKVERLRINCGSSPSSDPPYRAFLPMKHLRALMLHHCASPHIFVHALRPTMRSPETVVCPELEELVIVLRGRTFDMKSVIGVAAARASKGAKLKTVRIVGRDRPARTDVLELEKHVFHVGCGPASDDDDDIDEKG
jgi:hypothetical protein